MALGAKAGAVVGGVVKEGLILASLGVIIGAGVAYWMTRLMASMIYGVSATDPITFVLCVIVLLVIALVASWVPAMRAARVSPMEVLRAE